MIELILKVVLQKPSYIFISKCKKILIQSSKKCPSRQLITVIQESEKQPRRYVRKPRGAKIAPR